MKTKNPLFTVFLLLLNLIGIIVILVAFYNDGFNKYYVAVNFGIAIGIIILTASRIYYENYFERIISKINTYLALIIHRQDDKDYRVNIESDKDLVGFGEVLVEAAKWIDEKDFFQDAILELVNSVANSISMEKILENIMPKIIKYTDSNCAAFYFVNKSTNRMEIKASVGFNKNIYSEFDVGINEGFFGHTINADEIKIVNDIPDDTIYSIRTFLGQSKPKNAMIVPVAAGEEIVGVLVLASIYKYNETHKSILNVIKSYMGVSLNNILVFERSQRLSNELNFQNRLIQDLNDDLEKKVNDRTVFLNSIINSIEDYAIYSVDKDFKTITWNTGAEKIWGFSDKQIIGKDITLIKDGDDNNISILSERNNLNILKKDGKIREHGWQLKKDGSRYYADTTVFRLDNDDGEIIGYMNVTRDITSLRNVEETLILEKSLTEKLLSGSSRKLIICDMNGYIGLFNTEISKYLGTPLLKDTLIFGYVEEGKLLYENLNAVAKNKFVEDGVYTLKNNSEKAYVSITKLNGKDEDSLMFILQFEDAEKQK